MKKLVRFLICGSFLLSSLIFAQVLEVENTQELSKDARKGELLNFWYDQGAKNFVLVFAREKGKSVINEVYQFDYNLKLIKNETLEQSAAKDRYPEVVKTEKEPAGTWKTPKVVRVDPAITGQIVLRQGTLSREWAKTVEDRGNYRYTTHYWKYTFDELQRVTPKFEGLVSIPEGAPAFVVKMAQKSGERVNLLVYSTDEPPTEVTTGRQNFVYTGLWSKTREYASASGDILIVGRSDQMDFDTKDPKQVFLLLKYSAEDLSQKHYETFTLKYMQDIAYKQILSDGSMVLIFAPMGGPGMKNKDPNTSNWTYIRVGKDATILDNIPFETKGGIWIIQNAVLSDNNEVFLYGAAVEKKKDKYFNMAAAQTSFDNIQVLKIANGAVGYLTNVNLDGLKARMKKPGNQKSAETYGGKDLALSNTYVLTTSGDFIFSGQMADRSAIYFFHFSPNGEFKGQYVVNMENQSKEFPIDYTLFENPDKQTITVFIAELTGVNKGRQLKYPRMATIDIGNTSISDVGTYGFGKKGEYFLDDIYPITVVDDGSKIVLFSRDSKDAEVWLGRIKVGK